MTVYLTVSFLCGGVTVCLMQKKQMTCALSYLMTLCDEVCVCVCVIKDDCVTFLFHNVD